MNKVLFICTGNYYRSRMAEELFNYWSRHYSLLWEADSVGLRPDMSSSPNVGPISKHAVAMLQQGGYPVTGAQRYPRSLKEDDFINHDMIVCLYRKEHQPVVKQRFPRYDSEITYWEVADLDEWEPEKAFQHILYEVVRLIYRLNLQQNYETPGETAAGAFSDDAP